MFKCFINSKDGWFKEWRIYFTIKVFQSPTVLIRISSFMVTLKGLGTKERPINKNQKTCCSSGNSMAASASSNLLTDLLSPWQQSKLHRVNDLKYNRRKHDLFLSVKLIKYMTKNDLISVLKVFSTWGRKRPQMLTLPNTAGQNRLLFPPEQEGNGVLSILFPEKPNNHQEDSK